MCLNVDDKGGNTALLVQKLQRYKFTEGSGIAVDVDRGEAHETRLDWLNFVRAYLHWNDQGTFTSEGVKERGKKAEPT